MFDGVGLGVVGGEGDKEGVGGIGGCVSNC